MLNPHINHCPDAPMTMLSGVERDFGVLRGNFAMELWNTGCAIENALDMNAPYWDEALDAGHLHRGVAVDDGHSMD